MDKDNSTKSTDSKDKVKYQGVISKVLPGSEYLVDVDIDGNTFEIVGYISGKMRKHYIRLAKDDRVDVEITPYDISKCRITYRHSPARFNKNINK